MAEALALAKEQLDDAVGLRGYGLNDPLLKFKREAHLLYQSMTREIRSQTLAVCYRLIHLGTGT